MEWTALNPVLMQGEIGYESDTGKFKIGDGTTNWQNLKYYSSEVPYAGAELVTNGMTGVAKVAYGDMPVNSYGSSSTYQTSIINVNPQVQTTHWNSSGGATLDVTFRFSSGVSKALGSVILNLGTGYGVPSVSIWYVTVAGHLQS